MFSPDLFLTSYVKDIMTHFDKPFLILQLDEHSSDAGYTTRIAAGMRSFENYMKKKGNLRDLSPLPWQGMTALKREIRYSSHKYANGGELVTPSMTEYTFHFYDADIRLFDDDPRHYKLLRSIEHRYEKIAADIIGDQLEPDFSECVKLMDEYRIRHYIAGETSINVGRALYYIRNKSVDAIIPMFCCPGVVTSSIYRKIQEDFDIPIIDIFHDGTGNPNLY